METIPTGNEVDITDRQALQSVLNFLEKSFPESLHTYQFLKNIQLNLITKDHLWPCQIFVNDQQQIRCVLVIFSLFGFKSVHHLLSTEEKSAIWITFFCDNKADFLLVSLLQKYVPWSATKVSCVYAIEHRFSSVIESFIHDNNHGTCHSSSYHQLEIDKATFVENNRTHTHSCPSDIVIRPLSTVDAVLINDTWRYKSSSSLYQIMYEIEHFPAFGAYRDEKLISWCLTKFDGNIGTVFTQPEARGLGLATMLNIRVLSKLFDLQERAFCYIAYDNLASIRMYEKLGFHRTCSMDWVVVESK